MTVPGWFYKELKSLASESGVSCHLESSAVYQAAIRIRFGNARDSHCPVTAVAAYKLGVKYTPPNFSTAGHELGLGCDISRLIADSADTAETSATDKPDRSVRRRLLLALGLPEDT